MSGSALYRGTVRHTRLRPFHHDFSYRVYYGLFDVDELDALDERHRWFSVDRFNLHAFHLVDHGPADGSSLRTWAESIAADAGVDLEGGPIRVLAYPRVLGYGFDPISVWYCHGPDGDLRAVLHEVRNTFGDRHTYVAPIGRVGTRHSAEKRLHVSPFNDLDQRYDFTVGEPGERLTFSIAQHDADGLMFRAGMNLTRMPFTDGNLWRLFWTHPLLTFKVIGGIHWQAFKIWLKGGKYVPRPEPGPARVSVVESLGVPA